MQSANDDHINSEQSKLVALHAQYLLALKGHRRGAYILGFMYGVLATVSTFYLLPKILRLVARLQS